MPAGTWLRAWQACGADWLLDWSRRHTGWLPALLHAAREADTGPALDMGPALRLQANPGALRTLAAALAPWQKELRRLGALLAASGCVLGWRRLRHPKAPGR